MSERFVFDDKIVLKLAEILNNTQLSEIEYEIGEMRIRVARQITMTSTVASPVVAPIMTPSTDAVSSPKASEKPTDHTQNPGAVKAPMVGTVYASASPDAAPFIQVGAEVKAGQTLLIIEAMKVMNQIRAPKAGRISEIFFKDGEPVEYDHVLLLIE